MDSDIKELLQANLKLSQENNQLLKKVRSVQQWALITKVLYWFIIIGVALGALYFVKPYLGGVLNIYSGGVSDINSIEGVKDAFNSTKGWQDLIKDANQ